MTDTADTAVEREATRERYIREYPQFDRAARRSKKLIKKSLRSLAVKDAHVKVRAKDVASFVKKLRKFESGFWEEMNDKVGAQIVVHTLAEVRELRALFEAGDTLFEYLGTKDKSVYLGDPRALRYSGVHIQVVVPGVQTSDGDRIECEIQLRTQAQDDWAYLEHGLIYKPTISPPVEIARRVARLSVLVEMFDEEVDNVMEELKADPRYETALLLNHAERLYYNFVTTPGDPELSLEVLNELIDTVSEEERDSYPDALSTFVELRRTRIEEALRDYGARSAFAEDFNYFLFSQPESLILAERIENRPLAVARAIRNSELASPIRVLAEVWGAPLPTS